MKYMTGKEIRDSFLKFFERKGHTILPSASLIPEDPQLLFTIAGMVPFKPIFWGRVEPTYTRIATVQKCLRTLDIDEVGKTPRHHTFFEMLGNFSFGDYFKREAIEYAWEYVTEVLKIPEKKLWVSVYEKDEEAFNIWRKIIGIPERKIIKMGKEDNFWGPAGPTGPCGPDTEIFFDTGRTELCDKDPRDCDPSCNCGRFVEIWNLVFTEFYQDENGELHPLPRKNIDTGAGLERLTAAIQGVYSNFETDLFKPIIEQIERITGKKYGQNEKYDVSIRVVADHSRAITALISDGVFPSNEGRGYVLRRIIRRASRHGWLLGKKEPFIFKVIHSVVEKLGDTYTEMKEQESLVEKITKAEEERFLERLDQGINMLDEMIKSSSKKISGKDVFKLYDTYGFPPELTMEIAKEHSLDVDMEGFEMEMKKQRERARFARGEREFVKFEEIYKKIATEMKSVEFTGYTKFEDEAEIKFIIKDGESVKYASEGETVEIITEKTPFYAEKGGQISDTGEMYSCNFRGKVVYVSNPYDDIIVHKVEIIEGTAKPGQTVKLTVDESKRIATMRAHTATHLLHKALKEILGEHVNQAGSLVEIDRLRFDFTHYEAIEIEDLKRIEERVNEKILESLPVEIEYKSLKEAQREGAIALFEEKYGNVVRVVKIDDYSKELCGGTHVSNTSQIGLFKIVSEESISAGVRRIEALTGFEAYNFTREIDDSLDSLSSILEIEREKITDRVKKLIVENKNLKKLIKVLQEENLTNNLDRIIEKARSVGDIKLVELVVEEFDNSVLRNTIDKIISKLKDGVVLAFNKKDKSVSLLIKVSKNLTDRVKANEIARILSKILGGGGGGRPDFAQAGGKYPDRIQDSIKSLEEYLRQIAQVKK